MELKLEKRDAGTKAVLGKIRREGNIPAILYSKGKEGVTVVIPGDVFKAHLRHIQSGCLSTQVFQIELDGKKRKAIVKDIQYERVTYAIEHIDLMEIADTDRVSVHVPILCKGEDVCVGITQGGQLKRIKRSVKVSMQAKMPSSFILDVSALALGDMIRVKDIPTTPSMKISLDRNAGIVTVSK